MYSAFSISVELQFSEFPASLTFALVSWRHQMGKSCGGKTRWFSHLICFDLSFLVVTIIRSSLPLTIHHSYSLPWLIASLHYISLVMLHTWREQELADWLIYLPASLLLLSYDPNQLPGASDFCLSLFNDARFCCLKCLLSSTSSDFSFCLLPMTVSSSIMSSLFLDKQSIPISFLPSPSPTSVSTLSTSFYLSW